MTGNLASFRLTGARLIDPAATTDVIGDIAIVEGMLVPPSEAPSSLPEVAAAGLVVAPGLCDMGAHLASDLDDAAAVTDLARSAARGGFTSVCVLPDATRPLRDVAAVARLSQLGADAGLRLRIVASLTRRGDAQHEREQLADLAALVEAGAVAVAADRFTPAALTRAALIYLAPLDVPLVVRPEDPSLAGATLMRSGETAMRLGIPGWPASAELIAVERDLALADGTGAWIHFARISTRASLDAIRRARDAGVRVTCDVTTHHLALFDEWVAGERHFAWESRATTDRAAFATPLDPELAYDGNCRIDPPRPSLADAGHLLDAVADATVDAVATGHAPQPLQRKQVEYGAAAPGMVGLQTALPLGLTAVGAGGLDLAALLGALSSRPAKLIGEQRSLATGQPADLVVFDPAARWQVEREALASVHANTPLLGRQLSGVVRLTVADGQITHDALTET
jgi:dihydroorotase